MLTAHSWTEQGKGGNGFSSNFKENIKLLLRLASGKIIFTDLFVKNLSLCDWWGLKL